MRYCNNWEREMKVRQGKALQYGMVRKIWLCKRGADWAGVHPFMTSTRRGSGPGRRTWTGAEGVQLHVDVNTKN